LIARAALVVEEYRFSKDIGTLSLFPNRPLGPFLERGWDYIEWSW
jgi:hypothetical protein